jgi:hypothetical protein
MPSSISSSEAMPAGSEALVRAGFVRMTASDRPGVAQPVPTRDIPPRPWGPILLGAAVLGMLLVVGWELYWRSTGVTPGYYNSNSEWAQRTRHPLRRLSATAGLLPSGMVTYCRLRRCPFHGCARTDRRARIQGCRWRTGSLPGPEVVRHGRQANRE